MRIGLNTGPVVVGRIGDDLRMDYTAVGDTTTLAARLQQLARPGSVVVSEATHRAITGYFETLDLGEGAIKGRAPANRSKSQNAARMLTKVYPMAGRQPSNKPATSITTK